MGVRTHTPDSQEEHERSYNGVGKSLLVEIIHFCLGSNKNDAFKQHLSGWEFSLEFVAHNKTYIATRSADKQNEVLLNNKPLKLAEFNSQLECLVFQIPDISSGNLSFRSLIPRFIRRGLSDYNDPKITSGDKEQYTILLRNLFLLGLDIGLIEKKYGLRTRQTEIENFEKNFRQDPFIREYYTGNKDVSLQTRHLEEQIQRLEVDLGKFKVADDFYEIEKDANELNSKLRELKNQKVVLENALHNIEKSIQIQPDISHNKLKTAYNELLWAFKDEALKRLEDVSEFHELLLKNRIARLGQERLKTNTEMQRVSSEIQECNRTLNEKLAYLSDKRALDQYVSVSSQRSELLATLHKLQDYQQLMQKSRENLIRIRKEFAEETIKTNTYLNETNKEREQNFSLFAELVRNFYPEAPAGITLDVNDGENKVRYDFDVRIEADGSDGINAVKIFCYDLAILLMGHNHSIDFIWHDSRLFSDIDPRQRAILFRIANEFANRLGKQYIATVNQDQLEAMKSEFTDDEYSSLFAPPNIVLTLKDDGPSSKLLGTQIDMHY